MEKAFKLQVEKFQGKSVKNKSTRGKNWRPNAPSQTGLGFMY